MTETTTCVIAGGGPAGAMLGLLLARAGVPVLVLEKHADFLRDFRGDTIHTSTLRLMDELGLAAEFNRLPQARVPTLTVRTDEGEFTLADFRRLGEPYPYIAIMPQWDFLDFIADHARRLPGFELRLRAEATGLIRSGDRVVGLTYTDEHGAEHEVRADLTVAADGRDSTLRAAAGLHPRSFGAPMDVLWFRLSTRDTDQAGAGGRVSAGRMLVLINRTEHWQLGYVIAKGGYAGLRAAGLDSFRRTIAELAPFLADRVGEIATWDDVRMLSVQVNRLRRWWQPGLLCIGDAAHAMSPLGGVGINLAIQDAVATANLLAGPLRAGTVTIDQLARVQSRRTPPTVVTQGLQRLIQRNFVAPLVTGEHGDSGAPQRAPLPLRVLRRLPVLQALPALAVGIGIRPEHVEVPAAVREAAPTADR